MYRYILFDFDGTIANSQPVVTQVLRELASQYRFQSLSVKEFKHQKGMPLLQKLRMLWFMQRVGKDFTDRYGEKVGQIKAYDHMLNLLEGLHRAGYALYILSSNQKANVQKFLELNHIAFPIPILPSRGLFGKHKSIRNFRREKGCGSAEILYVGDEIRDIKACKKAGVDIAFVKWGMDGGEHFELYCPEHVISSAGELEKLLMERPA